MPRPGSATKIVAGRIRRLRDERRWSAQRLANECGQRGMPSLTRSTIAKIENGLRDVNVDEMDVLAAALGIAVRELTDDPSVTVLHLSDLQFAPDRLFGIPTGSAAHADVLAAVCRDLDALADTYGVRPDLIVITGGLGFTGRHKEFDVVKAFLEGLVAHLRLTFARVAVVPGNHDVNMAMCQAYFAECDANDEEPRKPYWPGWKHFATLFESWPNAGDLAVMHSEQPWSLYEMKDLRVVVAGFNSTVDHDADGRGPGAIGKAQMAWFKNHLTRYEESGWLRIGAVHHNPLSSAPVATENLDDTDLLDRELGRHLNVLLHGHAERESAAARLASGLVALGTGSPAVMRPDPSAANAYQVLRFTPDGLTRLTRRIDVSGAGDQPVAVDALPDAWSAVHDGQWHAAAATLPVSSTRLVPAPRHDPDWVEPASAWARADAEVDEFRDLDSRRLLLDRIADVFLVRRPDAKIHRINGKPPLLRMTYTEGSRVRQQSIGACVGPVTEDDVNAFVSRVHGAGYDDTELISRSDDLTKSLRDYARRRGVRLRTFLEYQGLIDLTPYVAGQAQRLAGDVRYLPEAYVSQRFTDATRGKAVPHEDVVRELLSHVAAEDGRFILLLGDFGVGKTFALRELTRRITEELPHLTPVLIDLRMLDKSNTVQAHVAAHLARHQYADIDLRALWYLLGSGRLVLIFDGFDELVARATYDRAAEHLDTLLGAAHDDAKIVVASRTQHFMTSDQIRTAMGARIETFPQRRILSLTTMSREQVLTLLERHLRNAGLAARRLELLERFMGLAELAKNPRMLGFIAKLDEEQLRTVAGAGGVISPAGLYQHVLTDWLSHEEERTQGVLGAVTGLTIMDLWDAVTALAVRIWENNETHVDVRTLGDVAGTLTRLAGGRLTRDQIAYAVGAGSLLVRDEDTDYFSFIHESVVEWLVARRIADDLAEGAVPYSALLDRRVLSEVTVDFLSGLADVERCRSWAKTALAQAGDRSARHANASRIIARLSSAPRLDLREISLREQELSHRDWPEANLEGADLTAARLSSVDFRSVRLHKATLRNAVFDGADLSNADLSGADLRHASLVRTNLSGADLRGADLADARLMDVDLTGARIDGSVWRRTALVAPIAEPALLDQARRYGATLLAPDQGLEIATRPARIGVRFGFDEGRLPRPLAYDAEGALLAFGNEDGTVLVCDAEDGRPLRTLAGHTERTYAVMFHPSEPVLATGSLDGTVRLWDATVGKPLHVMRDHPGWVWPMVFSPDKGEFLATGANDGSVRVWHTASGQQRFTCTGHQPPVWTATFDPRGLVFATGDDNGARVFDLSDGRLRHVLPTEAATVFWLRFDRAGRYLIGGCGDGAVRVWDPHTGKLLHKLVGDDKPVYALDFHPSEPYIISAHTSGRVFQWILQPDGTAPVRNELAPHAGRVYRVTFSPGGKRFATGDSEGAIRLWDAATCEQLVELDRHHASVWPMMFRPDGERMATSSNDYTVKLWRTKDGAQLKLLSGHERRVNMVTFSPDDSMLASSGNDGVVRMWNPRTGEVMYTVRREPDRLVSATFGRESMLLATASNDGRVHVWTGKREGDGCTFDTGRLVDLKTDNVWATVFDPVGEHLATANDDGSVDVLYYTTGRSIARLPKEDGRIRAMAFSPDGKVLACGGDGSRVRLYDMESKEACGVLEYHRDRVFSLAYRPDGRLLATASHDGTVALWDTATQQRVRLLQPERDRLWTVAFHPGGRILATGGDKEMVDIWDADTGERLQELRGHTRRVCSVAFSHGGTMMASSSTDGTIRLWRVEDNEVSHVATLLGLVGGWVAYTPLGRYKCEGDMQDEFWHTAGMIRFEPGELAAFLPDLQELPRGAPLF